MKDGFFWMWVIVATVLLLWPPPTHIVIQDCQTKPPVAGKPV